jgi:hypothetical protein
MRHAFEMKEQFSIGYFANGLLLGVPTALAGFPSHEIVDTYGTYGRPGMTYDEIFSHSLGSAIALVWLSLNGESFIEHFSPEMGFAVFGLATIVNTMRNATAPDPNHSIPLSLIRSEIS